MKILFFLFLAGAALAKESPLKAILRSPVETLKLYNSFKGEQQLSFQAAEDRMRFRLFRKSAEFVAEENSVEGETAEFALNFFSALTESEKQSWLGFNATGAEPNPLPELNSGLKSDKTPDEKLWTDEGKVTAVRNQGACGSCWTFGAVGGLETRYARVAGFLKRFSEQEFLDCVYEGRKDGCRGGWMKDAYEYSARAGGRLARAADYPYTQRDEYCQASSKPDAMIAAKIWGNVAVERSEQSNINALADGSLAVAFQVTDRFQSYSNGILKDETCRGYPNHAVTAVGYTKDYVLVKNSWGEYWGDAGYVKFTRNHHNCHLWNFSSYPSLVPTGIVDDDKARPTTGPRPDPNPNCRDNDPNCIKDWCVNAYIVKDHCQRTCGACTDGGDDDGEDGCPGGTTLCPDGICRHEHMC
ncbi:digestive cysteine proteinase 3-like [Bolinopsis microptera]|uniref:digestive cysteine proteinase 3-like n=1 Tax=Bolinopsis microptera TaxID=2820187 RepID=UPI00307AF6E5